MDQTLLTCPLCKRENEAGTRFCRNCGRLLVEADLGVSTTEHAPLYDAQTSAPARWDGEAAASEGSRRGGRYSGERSGEYASRND